MSPSEQRRAAELRSNSRSRREGRQARRRDSHAPRGSRRSPSTAQRGRAASRTSRSDRPRDPSPSPVPTVIPEDPASLFDFFPSDSQHAERDCVNNFMLWASLFGIVDGLIPLRHIFHRIYSFEYLNPSMLAGVVDAQGFFDKTRGKHPEVVDNPFSSHVLQRLVHLAQVQSVQAPLALGHQSPQLPGPPPNQQAPQFSEDFAASNRTLAKALEHLSSSKRKRHKGILNEEPDSEDDDFDLAAVLTKSSIPNLPPDWFASLRTLGRMDSLHQKAKTARPQRASHFVTDTTLENWIPSWLGASMTPAVKQSVIKQWKKDLLSILYY